MFLFSELVEINGKQGTRIEKDEQNYIVRHSRPVSDQVVEINWVTGPGPSTGGEDFFQTKNRGRRNFFIKDKGG